MIIITTRKQDHPIQVSARLYLKKLGNIKIAILLIESLIQINFRYKFSPSKVSNPQKTQVNPISYQGPKRTTTTDSITSSEFVHVKSVPKIPNGTNVGNESPTSMLSTASEASAKLATKTASTLESFRLWGKSAYKCTRQIVSEKLGKTSRTIDPELDVIIEVKNNLFNIILIIHIDKDLILRI